MSVASLCNIQGNGRILSVAETRLVRSLASKFWNGIAENTSESQWNGPRVVRTK